MPENFSSLDQPAASSSVTLVEHPAGSHALSPTEAGPLVATSMWLVIILTPLALMIFLERLVEAVGSQLRRRQRQRLYRHGRNRRLPTRGYERAVAGQ